MNTTSTDSNTVTDTEETIIMETDFTTITGTEAISENTTDWGTSKPTTIMSTTIPNICQKGEIDFGAFGCVDQVAALAPIAAIAGVIIVVLLITTICMCLKFRRAKQSNYEETSFSLKSKEFIGKSHHVSMNDYVTDDQMSYRSTDFPMRDPRREYHVSHDRNFHMRDPRGDYNESRDRNFNMRDPRGDYNESRDRNFNMRDNRHDFRASLERTNYEKPAYYNHSMRSFDGGYSDIMYSGAFQDFKPQLDNIDTTTDYFANRPSITLKSKLQ